MVDRGLAWHYKQYADQQDPSDRDAYSAAEKGAQEARRGDMLRPRAAADMGVAEAVTVFS